MYSPPKKETNNPGKVIAWNRFLLVSFVLLIFSSSLFAQSAWNAPGDTLSVIQRPILNVPAIHIPGETMVITAIAPSGTSGWSAALLHGNKRINLSIFATEYNAIFNFWTLQAHIPPVQVFELYDLELTANGDIYDVSQNAVQVIPTRKTNYYFIHITDLHLPNRLYYPNPGYDTDSTSVNDFRAVIEDINLLRPEFVLLTGDLLNEGELENLANQYWYGWASRLLSLIEVPVYVTNGNHDIGGWNSTPGPQGSSRKHWWRYFGWKWLDNTSMGWNNYTQDYSFTYGNIHFIGLESYDNYDSFRYNIYGANSFIPSQLTWLNNELALNPELIKVLFYHYDFSEQLNLTTLGARMGLWGHIHYNSGSIYEQPYNLATRSVCDGNRAYRAIRVNGNNIIPQSTIYAGLETDNLRNYFIPSNTGVADSVMCVVTSNLPQSFDNGLIKFIMPSGNANYTVTGGVLEQVDRGAEYNVCYVKTTILANVTRYISIKHAPVDVSDPVSTPSVLDLKLAFPNPFMSNMQIVLNQDKTNPVSLEVFNMRGERIRTIHNGILPQGDSWFSWDGFNSKGLSLPKGMYFLRASSPSGTSLKKIIKL